MPAGLIVIRRSRKRTAAKNEQISAMLKKRANCGPILFRKSRAVRKYEQVRRGIRQQRIEFFRGDKTRSRESLFELPLWE